MTASRRLNKVIQLAGNQVDQPFDIMRRHLPRVRRGTTVGQRRIHQCAAQLDDFCTVDAQFAESDGDAEMAIDLADLLSHQRDGLQCL